MAVSLHALEHTAIRPTDDQESRLGIELVEIAASALVTSLAVGVLLVAGAQAVAAAAIVGVPYVVIALTRRDF